LRAFKASRISLKASPAAPKSSDSPQSVPRFIRSILDLHDTIYAYLWLCPRTTMCACEKNLVRTSYRPDIDGLRAVAVLSVLAFHYGAPIRGGFIGVDVFFVISGFLITDLLAAEISAGTFSFLGFYERRLRRILPALLTMLAVVLFAGKFVLAPGDYASLAMSTAAAAFGVSNFFFHVHTGYFDQAADVMPLLHTWSLAVEEQFYLVWPLLLLAVVSSRIPVVPTLATIVIVGCIGGIYLFEIDPRAAFYMALPRAWELALGSLLVFLPRLSRSAGEVAAVAGLILITVGFMTSLDNFPGKFGLSACVGAALLIWPHAHDTVSGRLLGWLAPIGLISYGLYLWHWPVWVYFRIYINNGQPAVGEAVTLAAISIVLAVLSYRYVERPFRKPLWNAPRTVSIGFASILMIFCASMYIESAEGLPWRLPPQGQAMRSREVMWFWPCREVTTGTIDGRYCVFGAPWQEAKRKTVIWGDSNAQHFAPIVDAINSDPDRSFLVYAGYSVVLGDEFNITVPSIPDFDERSRRWYSNGLKLLKEDVSIDQVIFASNWLDLPARIGKGDYQIGLQAIRSALTKIINNTSTADRRFFLIGTVPHVPQEIVECAVRDGSKLWRRPCVSDVSPSASLTAKNNSAPIDRMFIEVSKVLPNLTAVTPAQTVVSGDLRRVFGR
jgi:peptidoglycan/LPS O-acetylase OafA/YrhL